MAIKGKKKKSGGKAKATAPRRPVVAPKPKVFARKGFQVSVASLLALICGLFFGWAFWHGSPGVRALTKAESQRIASARTAIDGALTGVGRAAPPANFVALPDLATSLSNFTQGKMSDKSFGKLAQQSASSAKAASTQIIGVNTTKIATGLPVQTIDQLMVAQDDLAQALSLFQTSSEMLYRATKASGKERASLISDAQTIRGNADDLISKGYRFYLLVLRAAGLQSALTASAPGIGGLPPGQTGLPPGFTLPTGAPSP